MSKESRKTTSSEKAQRPPGTRDLSDDATSASLFDNAYSERLDKKGPKLPIISIVLVLVGVSAVASYMLDVFGIEEEEETTIAAEATEDEASELTRLVEEIRSKGLGQDPADDQSDDFTEVISPVGDTREEVADTPSRVPPEKPLSQPEPKDPEVPTSLPEEPQQEVEPQLLETAQPEETSKAITSTNSEISRPEPEESILEPIPKPPERPGSIDYQKLLDSSPVAARLVRGEYSTLSYSDWRVVQQTDKEVWIDIVASWSSGGDPVHFIWSVNKAEGTIRALSQAARSLESDYGSP